jgi:hypothetical protein
MMDNEIVIVGKNMMVGPNILKILFKKSFSLKMLSNSKNIFMD